MPRPPALPPVNPFRIGGVVSDAFFTNRADELRRIEKALLSPGDKLLVFGPRRMGKSSTLDRAIANVSARKGVAFRADLSGATTVTDIANRILQAASRAMGRRWQDVLAGFLKTLTLKVNLSLDPATGLALPSLSLEGRTDALEEQRASLARVLDSIDQLAAQRKARVGIVLDEFQTISRFGGEGAEWHLRAVAAGHVDARQRRRIGLELRLHLEHDLVLRGRAVDRRNLALAEGVVQGLVDLGQRQAESRGGIAIDVDGDVRRGDLLV